MATLEKLVKSLESLKSLISTGPTIDESGMRCKEKMSLCVIIADMICTPEARRAGNFQQLLSYSMETLLKMCNDEDSNIRMIADECLNRIIRVHMDTNVAKLSLELHKEIKRNQSARSLRAALWRFSELAHLIRPCKAKLYMQNLVPCIINIASRKEEAVFETLATSIPKMLSALGCFMSDSDVKQLLETFMKNIHSENAVLRRTAAHCILGICLHCPKPQFFIIHTLSTLLDCVIPLTDDKSSIYTILGVLNCIRGLIGHLESDGKETFLHGSFGAKRKHKKHAVPSVDSIIQVYELCLHWTHYADHNIVTAALETLNELLTMPPPQLEAILVGNQGLDRSRIHTTAPWKLSIRTLSEISVATTIPLVEDSHLLEAEDISPTTNLSQWLHDGEVRLANLNPPLNPLGNTNIYPALDSIQEIGVDYPDCESVASEDIGLILKPEPTQSPEPDFIPLRDSPSPPLQYETLMEWDIGDAVESNQCPLIYCARRLVTAFLIPECSNTRVSVRALALTCLSQVIRLNPSVFLEEVDKNGISTSLGFSHICDVISFANHTDPQLRGLIRVLLGMYINSMYNHGSTNATDWFSQLDKSKNLHLDKLIDFFIEGLSDESSVCVKHTLAGLNICLINIMENNDYLISIHILEKFLTLVNNPYWLVKVKLIELICTLPYQCIHYITGNNNYQARVLESAILVLLSNEDDRVRKTTAEGILRLILNLYFPVDYNQDNVIVARGTKLSVNVFSNIHSMDKGESMQKQMTENVLSRIVKILVETLLISSSKHLSYGCIETLSMLSEEYSTLLYPKGWQFAVESSLDTSCVTSSGLFLHSINLLSSSPLSLDLESHQWLLKLTGNLFVGLAENPLSFDDIKLLSGAESLLLHVMRLLFIFVQVVEESSQSRTSGTSPLRRRTSRASSPTKIAVIDKEGKEEKKNALGHYGTNPQYLKLHDIIQAGYKNYKLTLDYGASEKFLNLIFYTLKCMARLLINPKLVDSRSIADELLQYLRITFILDSTSTIKVVNQLMKCLCKTHSIPANEKQVKDKKESEYLLRTSGFYSYILQKPLQMLSNHLTCQLDKSRIEEIPAPPHHDRDELTRKIKLFEDIVIQSLKEYTTTNNVQLQVEVLSLLTQLVHLKVNYYLLDNDLVFFKFVKNQLEYLEAGQIHHAETLISQIFTFLVSLLNEKNHSKMVVSVPEIIQMCDGLMASGQNPVTHSIPALKPVVQHVFLFNTTNSNDEKELETQREVVLAMLVRLAEYPQVLDILYNLMKEGWRWEDHWKRWYRQSIDAIRPLLAEGRLLINDCSTLYALLSLNNSFVAPLNNVLLLLFTHQQEGQALEHWLNMLTTMLFTVCTYKEERVLLQLEEMNLYVKEEGDDPLKVNAISKTIAPQHLLAKLLMRVIQTSVLKIEKIVTTNNNEGNIIELEKIFSNFLICCVLLFQSGDYGEVSKTLATLLKLNTNLQDIHKAFLTIANKCPLLTLLWADILMLLSIGDIKLWSDFMVKGEEKCSLNLKVIKQGAVILYCSYLAINPNDILSLKWLLENHIEDVVLNCQEPPVEKLLCSVYNLERNSKILLDSLSNCVLNSQPVFAHRILQTLENIHSNYAGSVLCLVAMSLIEHRNIAIARLAAVFCSRTIEYMLTLDKSIVHGLLKKDELMGLLSKLTSCQKHYKRHNALISLLKKLGEQVYGISSWDFEKGAVINMENISSIKLDKAWLLNQIINKCNKSADADWKKSARLLSKLDSEELKVVMSSKTFDKYILQHCFFLGTQISLQKNLSDKSYLVGENVVPIYDCARTLLLYNIGKICVLLPVDVDTKPTKGKLNDFLSSINIKDDVVPLVLGLTNYLLSFRDLMNAEGNIYKLLPEKHCVNVSRFGLLCMQIIHWALKKNMIDSGEWPWMIQAFLDCSAAIFSVNLLTSFLSLSDISCISASIFDLFKSISGEDIPFKEFKTDCDVEETKDNDVILKSSLRIASLVCWIENLSNCPVNVCVNIYKCLRSIIVSLGRNQKVNWLCRIPVEAWQFPIDSEIPPSIPMHLLHDTDILYQIVYRIRLFGWTGRHQFEEMWVCLLSALSPNPDIDNTDQEEISSIMQANSLAIDGITWLVLSTLAVKSGNSSDQRLLHVPRLPNSKIHSLHYWKRLEEMNEIFCWKMRTIANEEELHLIRVDKRPNLERKQNFTGYGFGQISTAFLQAQLTDSIEDNDDSLPPPSLKTGHDIDIRSCVQFVLDLYGQWILPNSGISLNLQLSMVKSILCLSDMFTERAHYEWMFNTFMAMMKNHPPHDEILHQYLIIGISKAAAVLNICEGDKCEKLLKIIESSLKSSFTPTKFAGINSLLYILQNVQNIKKAEANVEVQKFSAQDFRNKILLLAIDYVHKYFIVEYDENVEEDLHLLLALVMYLLEIYPNEGIDLNSVIKTITHIVQSPKNNLIYQAAIQGLERLVLIGNIGLNEQITRLALDRFSQADPKISLPALQLLMACLYSEKIDTAELNLTDKPPWPMEIMEKITALFDKIKRGYPKEVEIVCEILPGILSDFFPASDVLTKVIGEFLCPNQSHKKNMAAMVFQVFTQACSEQQLPLLQDWVVLSLNNFTNNLPAVTAVWSLCCFFISASTNPWLRAIFPHVQSRIRQYDFEDRQILCIAAVDFYNQLNPKQQEIFRRSFKETSSSQKSAFSDIVACL